MTERQFGGDDPGGDPDEVEPFLYRARKWALQQVTRQSYQQLNRIREVDWDVLLVLDACRYDTFTDIVTVSTEPIRSHASATPQWLRTMHKAGRFDGVSVVTANPQYEKVDVPFNGARTRYVFESEWHDELGTVLPTPVLDEVDAALEEHGAPVLGHLVQPHWPYVQRFGDQWVPAMNARGIGVVGRSAQVAMSKGRFDPRTALRAYRACLRSVWEVIAPRIGDLVGRGYTVALTADHGEVFGRSGDWWLYEHPSRVHVCSLTEVPWLTVEPADKGGVDAETEAKLNALGYA